MEVSIVNTVEKVKCTIPGKAMKMYIKHHLIVAFSVSRKCDVLGEISCTRVV